jgi:hypothetical protein
MGNADQTKSEDRKVRVRFWGHHLKKVRRGNRTGWENKK